MVLIRENSKSETPNSSLFTGHGKPLRFRRIAEFEGTLASQGEEEPRGNNPQGQRTPTPRRSTGSLGPPAIPSAGRNLPVRPAVS